jgi:hypothetical protein
MTFFLFHLEYDHFEDMPAVSVTVAKSRTYSWASPAKKVRLLKKKLGRKHLQLELYGFALSQSCCNFIKTNSSAMLTFFIIK